MRYTTVQGDMWDGIAHKAYGDAKYADVLIAANPEHRFVYIFSAGIELEVPEIEEKTAAASLPIWKTAEG